MKKFLIALLFLIPLVGIAQTYPQKQVEKLRDTLDAIHNRINGKQATLVSGTNLKTVDGHSLLGPGNIVISGSGTADTLGFTPNLSFAPGAISRAGIAEGSLIFSDDATTLYRWTHNSDNGDNRVFYDSATNGTNDNWSTPYVCTGVTGFFPTVFQFDGDPAVYMFIKQASWLLGDIYLYKSTDRKAWTVQNSGNPVITHSATTTDWRNKLFNVGVTTVGTTMHILVEGLDSLHSTGHASLGYATATLASPTFTLQATPQIENGYNPELKYSPKYNGISVMYNHILTYQANTYSRFITAKASLKSNLFLPSSWQLSPLLFPELASQVTTGTGYASDQSIAFTPGKTNPNAVYYNYGQVDGYQTYAPNIDNADELFESIHTEGQFSNLDTNGNVGIFKNVTILAKLGVGKEPTFAGNYPLETYIASLVYTDDNHYVYQTPDTKYWHSTDHVLLDYMDGTHAFSHNSDGVFTSTNGYDFTASSASWLKISNLGQTVFNDDSYAIDIRMESDGDANNFVSKGSTDNLGSGTNTPDASAKLDLVSTTKGFLLPRMTTTQRNAISLPAIGLIIYNSTDSAFQFYRASGWSDLGSGGGGGSTTPAGNFNNIQINRNSLFATPGSDSLNFNGGLVVKGIGDFTGDVRLRSGYLYFGALSGDYILNSGGSTYFTSGSNFYLIQNGTYVLTANNTGVSVGTSSTPTVSGYKFTVGGNTAILGSVRLSEISSPSTPAANTIEFFTKSDKLIYSKDDAGVERLLSNVPQANYLVVASGDHQAKTATQALSTYTTPNNGIIGVYNVSAHVTVTAVSSGVLTTTVAYTDETNAARTVTFYNMGTTSAGLTTTGVSNFAVMGELTVMPGTAITVTTTLTVGTATYNANSTIIYVRDGQAL